MTRQLAIPAAPSRTVLIAVVGTSPAVLTETLWALATPAQGVPLVPDHVVVITTSVGARHLRETILHDNQWNDFREALSHRLGRHKRLLEQRLRFGPANDHVRIIPTAGTEVRDADDIRTAQDHEAAADAILRTVREFSEEDGTRLIFSVAGGRKTMSALLFSVATLLGRPGDRITHVLVNAPYENPRHGFLYPGCCLGPEPLPAHTPEPKIELAEVPFVPLRQLFARDLGGRISSYMDLVRRLNDKVANLSQIESLTLDPHAQTLSVNQGHPLKVGPRAFALLLAYAHLIKQGQPPEVPFKNMGDLIKTLPDLYPPQDDTLAWAQEARRIPGDAHKSLSDLRKSLQRHFALSSPQVDRIIPHRHRTSIDLPASSLFISI